MLLILSDKNQELPTRLTGEANMENITNSSIAITTQSGIGVSSGNHGVEGANNRSSTGAWNLTTGNLSDFAGWNSTTPFQSLIDDLTQSTTEQSAVKSPQKAWSFWEVVKIVIICLVAYGFFSCCWKTCDWSVPYGLGVKGWVKLSSCIRHCFSCLR